ncbi:MAG: hypothetical protein WCK34_04465 [Bacteroidota bacterium]
MRFFILILLISFPGLNGYSQYYSTGQDAAAIDWRQIKTDQFQLVYPAPFEKKAQYLANILEIVSRNETHSLSAKMHRVPFLVHSQSVLSNGITVWAPRRIELYPCSPQQTNPEEWLEQLAVHEYRHAVQISKLNRGFSKALTYIFGEQVTGGLLGLYIPSWFLEGDATVTETAMTRAGRGRSASFESTLKAQVVEKGLYSYDKATLGSYRTYIPDAYSLGYFLVGQARKTYGTGIWNEALDRVAKYPFMVVPFNSGIRKVTGLSKTKLYRKSLAELDSAWQRQLRETIHTGFRTITPRNRHTFVSYNQPLFRNDSTILALKSGVDDIDRFILINRKTGKERYLLVPGPHLDGSASMGGDYLAWGEYQWDHRWSNRNFTEIRLYNFKTGRKSRLTGRSRYFSPILCPDGSKIAAIHISEENQCAIDLLEVPSGRLTGSYSIPGYGHAMAPGWSPDGSKIVFILLTEKGETMAVLNLSSGNITKLFPAAGSELLGPARFYRQYIVYGIDHGGSENIFAFDTLSGVVYRITSGRFAISNPDFSADQHSLICSDYTSDGLMVVESTVDTAAWIPLSRLKDEPGRLSEALAAQETANIRDSVLSRNIYRMNSSDSVNPTKDSIIGKTYPTRRYSRILNLFNPHSWAPASFDANNQKFRPGVMLLSQNTLSTMVASAGWEYNVNGQTGKFYANIDYLGWYPEISLRYDIGNRAAFAQDKNSGGLARFTWQESNVKATLSIPWNFSHGRYTRSLQPSIGTTLVFFQHNPTTPNRVIAGMIQTVDYRITASQYRHSGQKDVFPKFGQALEINYRNSPFGGHQVGSIFSAGASLYLPGLARHHGIWAYYGYQHREERYIHGYWEDLIRYPRGYKYAWDKDVYSANINYKLPLVYPDLSLGSVLYLKRIKLNLFYDWACINGPLSFPEYQSMGSELTFDFHLLRFVVPIEMGIRSIYYPLTGGYGFQLIYSISY